MATMSIRIPDDIKDELKDLALSERRSMNDVIILAIKERVWKAATSKSDRTRAAFARVIERDAELLEALGK